VTTLLLVRHGLTPMTGPVLAGWTPGVHLDERGKAQARDLALRLARVPITRIVSSPLERCLETAETVLLENLTAGDVVVDERVGECRYGDWTGRPLKDLAKDPMWKVVQAHPSDAVFPGPDGEPLAQTQARAVAAVRDWRVRIAQEHGADAVWCVVSHGDVIKALLADALGMHLDLFQRLQVDPCSVSVVRFTQLRPFVVKVNGNGEGLDGQVATAVRRSRSRRRSSDAAVGGGAG
jgi:probable phosphoglycerate mutase